MRKIPVGVYVLMLALIILLGSNYLANNNNKAGAESIGSSNQGSAANQSSAAAEVPPATGEDSQHTVPANPPPVPNEADVDQLDQSQFLIDVNISEQKVRILKNNKIIKEWVVSTGQSDSTPLGRFKIQNRGEWFFSEKYQQGAMWWVSFKDWGVYLFHSLPMDRDRKIITEEVGKLGSPASHGCVRLEIDNAKWIYDNIPQGTDVYIHK